jgi:hypothetical protein
VVAPVAPACRCVIVLHYKPGKSIDRVERGPCI